MNLNSLALRTDLVHDRFSAEVTDRGDYIVIKTPARPDYFWGNYLIMRNPPKDGDLENWAGLFEKEIGRKEDLGFVALTWDAVDGDEAGVQPFLDKGFSLQKCGILTAREVREPPKLNSDIIVRPLESDADWACHDDIHFSPDWEYGSEHSQREFIAKGREQLRAMVDAGLGLRFGAELDGKLVGEAGIYWENAVGRFNNVGTHRDYRRQGVCSTLVYESSKYAFEKQGTEVLVMEADEEYHAARIYESIGFKPTEKLLRLEWFDREKF